MLINLDEHKKVTKITVPAGPGMASWMDQEYYQCQCGVNIVHASNHSDLREQYHKHIQDIESHALYLHMELVDDN